MDGCPYDAEQVDPCKGCPGDCWDEVVLRTEADAHPVTLPISSVTILPAAEFDKLVEELDRPGEVIPRLKEAAEKARALGR